MWPRLLFMKCHDLFLFFTVNLWKKISKFSKFKKKKLKYENIWGILKWNRVIFCRRTTLAVVVKKFCSLLSCQYPNAPSVARSSGSSASLRLELMSPKKKNPTISCFFLPLNNLGSCWTSSNTSRIICWCWYSSTKRSYSLWPSWYRKNAIGKSCGKWNQCHFLTCCGFWVN